MKDESRKVRGRSDQQTKEEVGEELAALDEEFPELPVEEQNCVNAKLFLMTQGSEDGINFYDHLSSLLSAILDERPENAVAQLEERSVNLKRERLVFSGPSLKNDSGKTSSYNIAKAEWALLKGASPNEGLNRPEEYDPDEEEENRYKAIPNIMRQSFFFEQAGVGLPREEFIRIAIAMREIVDNWPIETVRFWGKVFGVSQSYYIVESEFIDGEYESDVSDNEEDIDEKQTEDSIFDDISTVTEDIKPIFKPPPRIPCETLGTGLNRKVYFVCSQIGFPWERLPHVTPAQVVAARKIRRFFTGDLNSSIVGFPPFPGVERNFLRAQIARISASTTVSPIGYFRFDDNEEEEEAEESSGSGRDTCIVDQEFEGMSMRDLSEPVGQSWCHHMQAILPQGRNVWFNPLESRDEGEGENESEDEERNEPDEPEPEVGPPLLIPISEDQPIGESPAWIVRSSSKFVPEYTTTVLQSNTWPGAWAFGAEKGKYFESVYIGWGVKNLGTEYEPELPPECMTEFPSGPEITETDDPTPEEEAAMKAALQDKEFDAEFGEDQGEDENSELED